MTTQTIQHTDYDVLIIGGSYAGLSAALTLARSLRKVLIIDSGKPCNRQAHRAHNLLTHDGDLPEDIRKAGLQNLFRYPGITLYQGTAISCTETAGEFSIHTRSGDTFRGKKLLFATGMNDSLPEIAGFSECWGRTVLHCPYCHGYEVAGKKLAVLGTAELAFELCRLLYQWSKDLTLYTNGPSGLDSEHENKIRAYGIRIITAPIARIAGAHDHLNVHFDDGTEETVAALFARPVSVQHCPIPAEMGCAFKDDFIEIGHDQQTTVAGVYAAGDNTSAFRSIAAAIAAGGKAGACINRALIEESF